MHTGASENILETVRNMIGDLRKSDRKVATVVLENPRSILGATVAEVARLAVVSQPTVIRFCAAIGCSGFQDFKIRLAESLALGTPATHSVIASTDSSEVLVGKIFDYTITSLAWARQNLDADSIGEAVALLSKARSISFFGFGASAIVARDAQQKFPMFGVPCDAPLDSHQQVMSACMMQPGDVGVVISNTGRTRTAIEIARICRENGAKVISMTGSESPITSYCDVNLIIETLDNTNIYTPTISRIAALVVIDVLCTSVALLKDEAHIEKFKKMKHRLNELRYIDII